MKKPALLSSIMFIILTFAGAGYVLLYHGKSDAGYAVVPMIFALSSFSLYRKKK